ncbi:MAG TPA: hypothetical protein VGO50_05040 [Pyrinomonadaceae bacterium]|jgi:hypothetical protein|nr:hypothetical protein [Pyrinomonadaceae bacterium]
MNKFLFITFLFILSSVSIYAQTPKQADPITEKQWKELLVALTKENWDTGFDLSAKYLKLVKEEDDAQRVARLRYMYLYSAAGKVYEDKMDYDKLERLVKDLVGKEIAFPYRAIKLDCNGEFNFICWSADEAKNKTMVSASNKKGTSIFAFEYVELKDKFDFAKNAGRKAELGGKIKAIEPNPNRSKIVILRIYVSEGRINLL